MRILPLLSHRSAPPPSWEPPQPCKPSPRRRECWRQAAQPQVLRELSRAVWVSSVLAASAGNRATAATRTESEHRWNRPPAAALWCELLRRMRHTRNGSRNVPVPSRIASEMPALPPRTIQPCIQARKGASRRSRHTSARFIDYRPHIRSGQWGEIPVGDPSIRQRNSYGDMHFRRKAMDSRATCGAI